MRHVQHSYRSPRQHLESRGPVNLQQALAYVADSDWQIVFHGVKRGQAGTGVMQLIGSPQGRIGKRMTLSLLAPIAPSRFTYRVAEVFAEVQKFRTNLARILANTRG